MERESTYRRAFLKNALLGTAGLWIDHAVATTDPAPKELRLVVPAPPGSQPDQIARWFAAPLSALSGLPVQVLNVPGAAGALAADAVLRAPPERGSLLLAGLDHVAYSHLNSDRRPLDPFVDFVPIAVVNRDTWVVATASNAPSQSMAALVERSQKEPLSYASTGEGSTPHLLSARFCTAFGIDAQHIPYRQTWMPDLIAGRIHFVVAPTPAVLQQLRSGRLTALASLTAERLLVPGSPPTVRELGRPDQVFYGGLFLFVPAALRPLSAKLNAWLREIMTAPDVEQRYQDAAIEPMPVDLEETASLVRERLRLVDTMRLSTFGRTR